MTNACAGTGAPFRDRAYPELGVRPGARRRGQGAVELSIVVPTFNELGNVRELLRRLAECLAGLRWEVIVVDDDSPDGTAALVAALGLEDARIRCLRRVGRRGLSSACLEGMALARGRAVAVIDADLQHDERLLPAMLASITSGDVDLVVGSRYVAGGGMEAWHPVRRMLSRAATWLTRAVLAVDLNDPMSGYFMIRPEVVRQAAPRLTGTGFKLLLDLVASSPSSLRIVELPYRFSARRVGQSKLDGAIVRDFLALLVTHWLTTRRRRILTFCSVGGSGVAVHVAVLEAAQTVFSASFPLAQTVAVIVSMASNFTLNNRLTFAEARLYGHRFIVGLSMFAAMCSLGAVVNVVTSEFAYQALGLRLFAAATGIVAGAACNFITTSAFVWRRPTAQSS